MIIGALIGPKLSAVLDVTGLSVLLAPVLTSPGEAGVPPQSCKLQRGDEKKFSLNLLLPRPREVQTKRRGLEPQIPDLHRLR